MPFWQILRQRDSQEHRSLDICTIRNLSHIGTVLFWVWQGRKQLPNTRKSRVPCLCDKYWNIEKQVKGNNMWKPIVIVSKELSTLFEFDAARKLITHRTIARTQSHAGFTQPSTTKLSCYVTMAAYPIALAISTHHDYSATYTFFVIFNSEFLPMPGHRSKPVLWVFISTNKSSWKTHASNYLTKML